MIHLDALTKYYSKNARGVIDISLDVRPGEIFGFIGPNGAGKSTTVRMLLNLIYPTKGSATIDGLDIVKDSLEIRKIVGYIPSEVHFYEAMHVQAFLDYSATFYPRDVTERQQELIRLLDLDVTRKIEDLSLGNKKKVAIVAALQHNPSLLILDEPTSGLDPLMQNVFFDLMIEEKKRGTTIFFSSHILSEVEKICDRVGVIKEGRLIQVAPIESLRASSIKKVELTVSEPFVSESKHIKDLTIDKDTVHFVYTGTTHYLMQVLNAQAITDITITNPTLDEIFMHVYTRSQV